MQKIINAFVNILFGIIVGSFFFFAVQAKGEPPNFDQYEYRQIKQESNINTALDDIVGIFLQNGLSGAIIICLGIWTFRTDKMNRAMQKENFDKLAVISQECSAHMASVSARLENLEREVEQSKQLEMMKRRS
tara:strand:+ start:1755 stop:2153 length:399 start_codon:yes stop_codon:yes gene_type:complete